MATDRSPTLRRPNDGDFLQWLGHPVRYLASGDQTNGTYCLSHAVLAKGHGAPPHMHDFDEGFYVLRGTVQFTAGNQSVSLRSGDFIHIRGGTAHFPLTTSEAGAEMLTIAAPAGFDQFQFAAGQRIETASSQTTKDEADIRADIDRLAKQFGIVMDPGEAAFDRQPDIQVTRADEGEVIDAVGDRYRFLAEGTHSGGRYAIWHATVPPGAGPPPHIHRREEEAFYVLDGELEFHADGQSFVGGAGTFVNLPVGSLHRFTNATEVDAKVLILVAPAGLEKMFRYTGSPVQDGSSPLTAPTEAEKARLVSVAADYGIELRIGGGPV